MATLWHDLGKRRIYEVPDNSTYTVDINGYRIYVPIDLQTAPEIIEFTNFDLWSRFVDFHFLNEWTTIAYDKSGGAFIENKNGTDVFEKYSLRLKNDWLFVPADYTHETVIIGNVRKQFGAKSVFDKTRLTTQVETHIELAESSQTLLLASNMTSLEFREALKSALLETTCND